jgi:hypothetical protein
MKQAQAAIEFLLTYGWAILVVTGAIVALAYFGVINPAKFYPDSCIVPPSTGLGCIDFRMSSDSVQLLFQNGRGMNIHLSNVSFPSCSANTARDIVDGESFFLNLTGCNFGTKGSKVKQTFYLVYNFQDSSVSKQVAGSITAKVE